MLGRNLKYLRKQKKASQEQIAQATGISRSALADYENGKSEPTAGSLIKLAKHFAVNVDDLLTVDLDTPLFRKSSSELKSLRNRNIRIVAITVGENKKENIEFVPVSAIAGYAQNFGSPEFLRDLVRFSIPKLSESTYRAFEIQGDSMPPIDNGFIVTGKFVEHYSDLKNGKRYILILKEEGVVFKRVINEVNENRRLVLVSDNPQYLPFSVRIEDVLEAWELAAFIGFPREKQDSQQTIMEKLHLIEQKLENLSNKS